MLIGLLMDYVKPQDPSDTRLYIVKKAENFFPHLTKMIKVNSVLGVNNYVYEGDIILPKHVDEVAKDYNVRACFLGFSHITVDLLKRHIGNHQWLNELTEEKLHELPKRIMQDSEFFKQECEKYGFKYFDLSLDYDKEYELAFQYLIR